MRTTLRLDEQLLREAKELAAQTGKTLTAVIEDALRESLARHRSRHKGGPVELPIFKGKGLRPGVDPDDSAGLLEIMQRRRDSACTRIARTPRTASGTGAEP